MIETHGRRFVTPFVPTLALFRTLVRLALALRPVRLDPMLARTMVTPRMLARPMVTRPVLTRLMFTRMLAAHAARRAARRTAE